MSQFTVPVVKIGPIVKHPNADSLSITEVEGCPVIIRTDDFKEGDTAIYIPVESVVPTDNPAFAFLGKEGKTTARIKAKKLRGIFSMGMLISAKFPMVIHGGKTVDCTGFGPFVGADMADLLGIVKYVEPEPPNMKLGGQRDRQPVDDITAPIYDVESHRKYKHLYQPGESVVVTEKIHGCNGRFVFRQVDGEAEPRLCVGSRNYFLKEGDAVWWKVAKKHDLANKLAKFPDHVLYGEVYGQVQDLKYGTTQDDPLRFAAFDVYSKAERRFLNSAEFVQFCYDLDIPAVPLLYTGPYDPAVIEPLAQGQSAVADQIKEGIVIKPGRERWDYTIGRVITKLVGEQYLLRKGGTEFQ